MEAAGGAWWQVVAHDMLRLTDRTTLCELKGGIHYPAGRVWPNA